MDDLSFRSFTAPAQGLNTTIGIIATNGVFSKLQCNMISAMGHCGLARAILKAIKAAAPAGGLPSWQSFHPAS
jgi:L-aminopeptidase/D-esterase-like protein